MEFNQPSSGSTFTVKNYVGALLLVYPRNYEQGIETSFGESDAIRADLVVLDGPESPQIHVDVLLFQRALIGQLRSSVGRDPVLGRVGFGVAKPGMNPPYRLETYTDEDAKAANTYLKAHPDPFAEPVTFTAPQSANGLSAPGATPPATASTPINTDDPAVVALLAQLAKQQAGAGAPPF